MSAIADKPCLLALSPDLWKPVVELLGIPALALGLIYTCVQIRKMWLDSHKTKLEIERMRSEIQAARVQGPALAYDTSSKNGNGKAALFTRRDALLFVPSFVLYLIVFWSNARDSDVVTAIRGMLVAVICILVQSAFLVLIVGLRALSRMLLDMQRTYGEMLLATIRSFSEMLFDKLKLHVSVPNEVASPQGDNSIRGETGGSSPENHAAS